MKMWCKIYRDDKSRVCRPKSTGQGATKRVLEFPHGEARCYEYHYFYLSLYEEFRLDTSTRAEQEIHEENLRLQNSPENLAAMYGDTMEEFEPHDGEVGITAEMYEEFERMWREDAALIQAARNPSWRRAHCDKVYEMPIFKVLMIHNTYESVNAIAEEDLFAIFQEALYLLEKTNIPSAFISQLAASIIFHELQGDEHIVLTDWRMLPALMLLLPVLEQGTRVTLPSHHEDFMGHDAYFFLLDFVRTQIPRIEWLEQQHTHEAPFFPLNCLVLGADAVQFYRNYMHRVRNFKSIRKGFFYTNWNFLTLSSLESARLYFLKTGAVSAVLQLPRPQKVSAWDYPAALLLDGSASNKTAGQSIYMAYMSSAFTTDGADGKTDEDLQDVSAMLALLYGEQSTLGQSCVVSVENIMQTDGVRLNPSFYAVHEEQAVMKNMEQTVGKRVQKTRLGQYAEVLRCQMPRKKPDASDIDEGFVLVHTGAMRVREVSLSELDPSSNFLDYNAGKVCIVNMTPTQQKYLLKEHDTIFAYRGSAVSIGKCGLVTKVGNASITGPAMCIIRPLHGTNPVWLHYQLHMPQVQQWIKGQVSGGNSLSINMETLKDIPLPPYSEQQMEEILIHHASLLECFERLSTDKRFLYATRQELYQKMASWV